MSGKRKITLGIAVVLVGFLAYIVISAARFQVATGASRADAPIKGLPQDASDITYYLPPAFYPYTCYDFRTSEAGYRQWVGDRKHPTMGPIKEGSCFILAYAPGRPKFDQKQIARGLIAGWSEGDRGLQMAYDLDSGRAYLFSHSR